MPFFIFPCAQNQKLLIYLCNQLNIKVNKISEKKMINQQTHPQYKNLYELHNLRPKKRMNHLSNNIISHVNAYAMEPYQISKNINPQARRGYFSSRKTIPLDTQVVRERQEMIVHPSKISKDVPSWFKGQTYKYYNRNQYNALNRNKSQFQMAYNVKDILHQDKSEIRSDIATPHSRKSSSSDIFYNGTIFHQNQPKIIHLKSKSKQLSPKIGSIESRNFELPKILMKIGKDQYINTMKPF